jgi:hypothetical protein
MKVFATKKYQKILLAQETEEVFNNIQDPFEENEEVEKEDNTNIKTLTPEDFNGKEQDDIEEEVKPVEPIVKTKEYPIFPTVFQALRWAKHNNEVVRINYTTLSGKSIIRDVEIVGDFFAKTTHRRNIAVWDQNVRDIRTYILTGISGYEFKGEKFTPKFNFSQTRRNLKRRMLRRKKRKQ